VCPPESSSKRKRNGSDAPRTWGTAPRWFRQRCRCVLAHSHSSIPAGPLLLLRSGLCHQASRLARPESSCWVTSRTASSKKPETTFVSASVLPAGSRISSSLTCMDGTSLLMAWTSLVGSFPCHHGGQTDSFLREL